MSAASQPSTRPQFRLQNAYRALDLVAANQQAKKIGDVIAAMVTAPKAPVKSWQAVMQVAESGTFHDPMVDLNRGVYETIRLLLGQPVIVRLVTAHASKKKDEADIRPLLLNRFFDEPKEKKPGVVSCLVANLSLVIEPLKVPYDTSFENDRAYMAAVYDTLFYTGSLQPADRQKKLTAALKSVGLE